MAFLSTVAAMYVSQTDAIYCVIVLAMTRKRWKENQHFLAYRTSTLSSYVLPLLQKIYSLHIVKEVVLDIDTVFKNNFNP